MNRKAIAIAIIAMMAVTSIVLIPADDSNADAYESNKYTSHYTPELYWFRNDTASFTYSGGQIYDTYYADITELEKKDAEFDAFIHGNASKYTNSTLIEGHSYCVYWKSTTYSSNYDKSFYVKGNIEPIYLNGGSYELTVLSITYPMGGSDTVSLVKARELGQSTDIQYRVQVGATYTFSTNNFNAFWFKTYSTPVDVTYRIDAKTSVAELGDTPVSEVQVNNIYAWYKSEVSLSGNYSIDKTQIMFVKGSDDEKRFVSEVVNKNVYYSLSDDILNPYNALKSGSYSGTFVIYKLCKSVDLNVSDSISKIDDSGKSTSFEDIILERQTEDKVHLFSTAYSEIKIAIGNYDSDKYMMYLMYSGNAIPLKSNSIYTIDNEAAKTYTLVVENKNNDTTSLYTTVAIYTEGVPEVDSNPDIFAAVCIGLCILVFGIILISGKKPKWSKKKYDERPVKKPKEKKEKQQPEQPKQETPAEEKSQQTVPPANDAPKEEPPKADAQPENQEEPKKKGFFKRKSKEE